MCESHSCTGYTNACKFMDSFWKDAQEAVTVATCGECMFKILCLGGKIECFKIKLLESFNRKIASDIPKFIYICSFRNPSNRHAGFQ